MDFKIEYTYQAELMLILRLIIILKMHPEELQNHSTKNFLKRKNL